MHSPAIHAQLEQCRLVLARADTSEEMRQLAQNLVDHLLEMHDARRLRAPVFLLALDTLELVPGMDDCVAALRAAASGEQAGG